MTTCTCGVPVPDGWHVDYCAHADPWRGDNAGPVLATELMFKALERTEERP